MSTPFFKLVFSTSGLVEHDMHVFPFNNSRVKERNNFNDAQNSFDDFWAETNKY